MEFIFYVALLPSVIHCMRAATVTTTGAQASQSCSPFASPVLPRGVHHTLAAVPDGSIIARRVTNSEDTIYTYAGYYIEATDSLIDSHGIVDVSTLTPAYCANACVKYPFFSLIHGMLTESF